MANNIVLAILSTSLDKYISRFFGVMTSKKMKENSKIFKWFNCLAYSTLSALLVRIIIFPAGALSDVSYLSRATVVLFCLFIFFIFKRNFVYPTVTSAIMMALLSEHL
jgi:branched-subunit amino acid transport protein